MKFRFIPFGPGKLEPRGSFGLQHVSALKTIYLKVFFFGFFLSWGPHDLVADLERIQKEQQALRLLYTQTNRKQRRVMQAQLRKQHARQA